MAFDALLPRDAVELGDAHASAQEVAGGRARVHGELAGVDDGEAAVGGEVGPVGEAAEAVGPVGDVVCLLGDHGELRGEVAVAEQEGRRLRAPGLEVVLGVLDENVEGVGDLLHDAEEVDVLAADLRGGLGLVLVLLVHVPLVRGRGEERDVHVEVVGELDRADELHELALEVLLARGGDHEVVLHRDGETLADSVPREGALRLREHARGGLVRHARGDALVEAVDVPLEFLVRVLEVDVGEDVAGEGGVGRVGDEAVDAVGEVLVRALERVGEVPPLVALVALLVGLDVAGRGAEDVLVLREGGLGAVASVGPPPVQARVAGLEIHRVRH